MNITISIYMKKITIRGYKNPELANFVVYLRSLDNIQDSCAQEIEEGIWKLYPERYWVLPDSYWPQYMIGSRNRTALVQWFKNWLFPIFVIQEMYWETDEDIHSTTKILKYEEYLKSFEGKFWDVEQYMNLKFDTDDWDKEYRHSTIYYSVDIEKVNFVIREDLAFWLFDRTNSQYETYKSSYYQIKILVQIIFSELNSWNPNYLILDLTEIMIEHTVWNKKVSNLWTDYSIDLLKAIYLLQEIWALQILKIHELVLGHFQKYGENVHDFGISVRIHPLFYELFQTDNDKNVNFDFKKCKLLFQEKLEQEGYTIDNQNSTDYDPYVSLQDNDNKYFEISNWLFKYGELFFDPAKDGLSLLQKFIDGKNDLKQDEIINEIYGWNTDNCSDNFKQLISRLNRKSLSIFGFKLLSQRNGYIIFLPKSNLNTQK